MAARPAVSLCMIVRDSARTLGACLESIAPWVDEMIVIDTGSVDETREIAQLAGAQVYEFPWCDDFAAARNESLRLARRGTTTAMPLARVARSCLIWRHDWRADRPVIRRCELSFS